MQPPRQIALAGEGFEVDLLVRGVRLGARIFVELTMRLPSSRKAE